MIIKAFRQIRQPVPRPSRISAMTTGVETTTGPLGQGCGNSVGMAMAGRWLGASISTRRTAPCSISMSITFCGDGDMMEGVSSEAASIAGHLKLGNLCWLYDNNSHHDRRPYRACLQTRTWRARFRAYGWRTSNMSTDANDTERDQAAALQTGSRPIRRPRPLLIVVDSHIGYRFPAQAGQRRKAHGEALGRGRGPPDQEILRLAGRCATSWYPRRGTRAHFDAGYRCNAVPQTGGQMGPRCSPGYRARYPESRQGGRTQMSCWRAACRRAGTRTLLVPSPPTPRARRPGPAGGKVINALGEHYPMAGGRRRRSVAVDQDQPDLRPVRGSHSRRRSRRVGATSISAFANMQWARS